jgi:gamma-F420-2:alpha-L-glutamate ligase
MKIWIITHESYRTYYSNTQLQAECQKQGHDVHIITTEGLRCGIRKEFEIFSKNKRITELPALVFNRALKSDITTASVLEYLESQKITIINPFRSIEKVRNKFRCYTLLAAHNLPSIPTLPLTPRTNWERVNAFLPAVVKANKGTQGAKIMKVTNSSELKDLKDFLNMHHEDFLLQKFISTSHGRDVRIVTVGAKILGAATRESACPKNFKANVAQGGKAAFFELPDQLITLTKKIIEVFGLDMMGIDLLFGDKGDFWISEINATPSFMFEQCLPGLNTSKHLLQYALKKM